MHKVMIEVHDAEHGVTALRVAMPELFDAGLLVEHCQVLLHGERDRAVEHLATVEKMAVDARWAAAEVATLRTVGERALDAITRVLVWGSSESAIAEDTDAPVSENARCAP